MSHRSGFTLVELSIVLVIIGLIIGGVLVGKDLIKAAEIRAAISNLQQLETTYNAFRLKYNCIPGDCNNATDYFGQWYVGIVALNCAIPTNGNGDGNGLIDDLQGVWNCESILGNRSLEYSGLLPKSIATPCVNNQAFFKGINDSCAYFYNDDLYDGVDQKLQNTITWASLAANYTSGPAFGNPALSPVQARQIDEKIDDGKPLTGKFMGLDSTKADSSGVTSWIANNCVTAGAYNRNEDFTCRALYYLK